MLGALCKCLRRGQPARSRAIRSMLSWRGYPAIDCDVADGHRHHEQSAKDQRRCRRRDSKCAAGKTQCEGQYNADHRFHGVSNCTRVFPGGRTWSAVTKPTVIASKRHAPIKRGGAGDGMSKNRHPAPITKPRMSPMMAANTVLPSLEREAIATEIP